MLLASRKANLFSPCLTVCWPGMIQSDRLTSRHTIHFGQKGINPPFPNRNATIGFLLGEWTIELGAADFDNLTYCRQPFLTVGNLGTNHRNRNEPSSAQMDWMNRLVLLAVASWQLNIGPKLRVKITTRVGHGTAAESATDGSDSTRKNTGLTQYDLVWTEMVKRRVIWLPRTQSIKPTQQGWKRK